MNTMIQLQILTKMDKGIIKDYYHMTTMDEYDLDETNAFIVKKNCKP